jgi:hypothetical protein
MSAGGFFIQFATRQAAAELMAECSMCGAMTSVPLAYAWHARSVVCGGCGTKMALGPGVLVQLKVQATDAAAEIEPLMAVPGPSSP